MEWEEKHFNDTPTVKMDKKTHLYTLLVRPDNSFEIFVDKKSSKKGNMLTHMKPSINPPKEIDDPSDKKPSNWVEEAKIADPKAFKPADWNEDEPRMITDPKATKPADWQDNAPEQIPNPEAVKPEDWDDEEDGDWEAPLIPNPACEKGCGEWKAPTIKNPAFKGKWKAPMIDNPDYKGVWEAKKIPNPNYFEDLTPASHMAPMAGIAIEVMTTNAGIHFDNFVVAQSLEAAFKFADSTYVIKAESENKKEKREKKEKKKKEIKETKEKGGFQNQLAAYLAEAEMFVTENPIPVAITAVSIFLGLVWLFWPSSSSSKKKPRAPSSAADASSSSTSSSSADSSRRETDAGDDDDDKVEEEEVLETLPKDAKNGAKKEETGK